VSSSHDNHTNAPLISNNSAIATNSNSNNKASSSNIKYLLSYEGMVSRQDLELNATWGHMKQIFGRIQTLGNRTRGARGGRDPPPKGMLTYLQMRRALIRIGIGWNRSSFQNKGLLDYDDDDISVLSFKSTSSGSSDKGRSDIISTDSQLLTLLATLVEMEEKHRVSKMLTSKGGSYTIKVSEYHLDQGLFLPEFIQAYKILVGGLQAFKSIPNSNEPSLSVLCRRLKERTLQMLRPFGPTSKLDNNTVDSWQASKKSYEGLSINTKQSSQSKKKKGSFLSNGDMKKIIISKDNVLSKIMEEHEFEMDVITSNIEELKQEDQQRRAASGKRRKRVKWVGLLLSGILFSCSIIMEIRRRDSINNGIEVVREAESVADRKIIAQLKAKKAEFENKLGSVEGKIRYQVNRNNYLEEKALNLEKDIGNFDGKELAEKAEMEHCFASHLESKEDLKREVLKNVDMSEELVWCQTRLQSQKRELEHVSVEGTSERGVIENSLVEDDLVSKAHKPLYLEMKYNKSICKSVFLRQIYSAVAGVAAGALLQGLVPIAVKLFVSKATVGLPAPMPKQGLEMVLVDGIFGSSIAFLLVQAVATFLMPL